MNKLDLSGTQVWVNELGSKMTFTTQPDNLTIVGTYESSVGQGQFLSFPLIGQYDNTGTNNSYAIGWTVVWNNGTTNAHSVTTWSGQWQWNDITSEWEILTTWLLTSEESQNDDWKSTLVGQDTFVSSTSQFKQSTGKGRRPSHPKSLIKK